MSSERSIRLEKVEIDMSADDEEDLENAEEASTE
jgi:hypothetical protein